MDSHHIGLEVENLEEAISFYKNLLGFEVEDRFSFMGEKIAFLTLKAFRIELIENQLERKSTHICFEVTDLHDIMNDFPAMEILEGPYSLQNGWKTVFYEGPNKEQIEFLQIPSKRAK